MRHGLLSHRAELIKTLEADDGRIELRAGLRPHLGPRARLRVMKIADDGSGDTHWTWSRPSRVVLSEATSGAPSA